VESVALNPNVINLKESSTLAINQTVKELRSKGEEVVHFGFGQSPFPVPERIVEEVKKFATCKDYLPTGGLKELRDEISTFLKRDQGVNFNGDHIFIGPGSKELIFQLLYLLEGPVILLAPSWVSYKPQINLRNTNTRIIQTKKENNYCVTANELDAFCSTMGEEQKILIINNPHNPTGHLYKESEIKEIAEVCRRHNIILISDEIYAQINFSKDEFVSFSKHLPERTIVTGGLSKVFSAGGYRLGFAAIPEELSAMWQPLCAMFSETFSSVSAPIQYGAVAAYRKDPEIESYIDLCKEVHKEASGYLYRRFKKMGLDCSTPEGAFYLMADFEPYREKLRSSGLDEIKTLTQELLKSIGVAMLPGTDFYMPRNTLTVRVATVDYEGEEVLRLARSGQRINEEFIETNCPKLKEGCDRLEAFLSRL
jgi:aspartate/methionine/tyrosine aminotransferase